VESRLEGGIIEDAADLFRLTKDQLLPLERFAERSAGNLIASIASHRTVPLHRLVNALGVPNVGEHTAAALAVHFGSLERLMEANEEDLLAVEGIGTTVAGTIARWFASPEARTLLRKLADVGVRAEAARPGGGPWAGRAWVLTGSLQAMTRPEAEERIRRLGGTPSSSVSRKTHTVVAGPGAGGKLEKAQRLGVRVIDEAAFLEELEVAERAVPASA
jgi:DNA ligase (NAD+)